MNDIDALANLLQEELSAARQDLGLPDVDLTTPQEMVAEAARLAELVSTRMRTIEDQLGNLDTTRSAVRAYVGSDKPI